VACRLSYQQALPSLQLVQDKAQAQEAAAMTPKPCQKSLALMKQTLMCTA
jgi:hypothetical protein